MFSGSIFCPSAAEAPRVVGKGTATPATETTITPSEDDDDDDRSLGDIPFILAKSRTTHSQQIAALLTREKAVSQVEQSILSREKYSEEDDDEARV